jgi:hypothetical protein
MKFTQRGGPCARPFFAAARLGTHIAIAFVPDGSLRRVACLIEAAAGHQRGSLFSLTLVNAWFWQVPRGFLRIG